jgi:hypothetical protein
MKKAAVVLAFCVFGISGCAAMHSLGVHTCSCAHEHQNEKKSEMCSACKSKKSSCQCASCKEGKQSACECGKSSGHAHEDEALSCGH